MHSLLAYLRSHIVAWLDTNCPFQECGKKFDRRFSYSDHISRVHRNCPVESIATDYIQDCNPVEKADSCDIQLVLEVNSTHTDCEICDDELSGIGQTFCCQIVPPSQNTI